MSVQARNHFDGRTIVRERVQDVEPILEGNRVLRSLEQKSDWGRHIARIPLVVYEKIFNDEYARGNVHLRMYSKEFDAIVKRWLEDPSNAAWRVDNPSNPFFTGWRR